MALGEMWHGNGKDYKNIFYVNIGYGIGSALIIDGKVYDNHSEFGHIAITDKKVRCGCGKYGCLEAVASGNAIEKKANNTMNKEDWITARELAEMAKQDNKEASIIFEDAGYYLGKSISSIANVFNPEKIIIGGGISRTGNLILLPLKEAFNKYAMKSIKSSSKIELSSLGLEAGVYGALTLILNKVFYTHLLKKSIFDRYDN